ncbi:MAG TPA: alpha/beta hydrolase [Vicinamibacterales bacterium]|nr:alpha/beta hydrolase [Vicinamibacterales bacterium]
MHSIRAQVILFLCLCASPVARSAPQALDLKPCTGGRTGPRAECGELMVPENRTTGQGRRIPINVMVLRAEQPGAKTALFLLAGGPGQGSTSMAGTANGWMAPLRASMDMVLMDQRGTGGSNPLACETEIGANPAAAFGHVRDPEVIRKCLAALQPRADLTQYTTDAAVADMEELRVTLGYDAIALYGGSYGTRIAQEYLRRHPDRTRAVVIDGVLPFDVGGPLSYARSLDGSIDRMLANCRDTPACQQANPNLPADLAKIIKRLDQAPAKATVQPQTGAPVPVTISRGDFLYAIRGMLYNAGAPNEIPAMITRAAATGDLSAFAQRYWSRAVSMNRSISYGMHLSVLCPEDVNALTDAQVKAETAGTRIGSYIVDEYRTACALWPKATVARDFRTPVTARVPVLLVSGKYDPVTPPEFGERIAKSLPMARTIVVATSGHGSAQGCPRAAALYVLQKGSFDGMPEVCK